MSISKNVSLQNFYIHFDLENNLHEIPIEHSIITEQTLKTILDQLNEKLFDNKLELQIFVYPPENGGFIKKFGVGVVVIGSFIAGSMFPDITNGVIMGLGDGRELKEYVKDGIIDIKTLVKGFLEKENVVLESAGIQHLEFYEAYKAKNNFYNSSLQNPHIKAIGFDKTHNFSIQRLDFFQRITDLSLEKFSFEPIDKYHKVLVISGINTEEDKNLVWQFKDKKIRKKFSAYMRDEDFYNFFLSKQIYLVSLVLKLRYFPKLTELGKIYIEKREIIKVYKFNGEYFSDFPENAEISEAPLEIFEINGISYTIKNEENGEKNKKEKFLDNQQQLFNI